MNVDRLNGQRVQRFSEIDRQRKLSRPQTLLAAIDDHTVHDMAAMLETELATDPVLGGRHRDHDMLTILIFGLAVQTFGSARAAARELADLWPMIRSYAQSIGVTVSVDAPCRHHWQYSKRRIRLLNDQLRDVLRRHTVRQTAAMGLCLPDDGAGFQSLDQSHAITGDGKVFACRYKARPGTRRLDKTTGELITVRADPDQKLFMEGGGHRQLGIKIVSFSVKGEQVNQYITLDVGLVETSGGETRVAVAMLNQLMPMFPGARSVVYDGAFTHTALNTILKAGLLPVVKTPAYKTLKSQQVGVQKVVGGTQTSVAVFAIDGHPHINVISVEGTKTAMALEQVKRSRQQNRDGTWRWYCTYKLPATAGGGMIRMRMDTATTDNFKRAYRVRAVTTLTPDWDNVHRQRSFAESRNRGFERGLEEGRCHSVGAPSVMLDTILKIVADNAHNLKIHQRQGEYTRTEAA
jgi:hypothetical protein